MKGSIIERKKLELLVHFPNGHHWQHEAMLDLGTRAPSVIWAADAISDTLTLFKVFDKIRNDVMAYREHL